MQSLRLKQIINMIPNKVGVADIGTDHAQIPIYLAQHTSCRPVIAGENSPGPYNTARNWICEAGLQEVIDLRLGSGLSILKPDEVEWAVIAGMGYKTIIEIISQARDVVHSLQGLILQPMQGTEHLRLWLSENYFQIVDEVLVKEDGKLFQIIVTKSGESKKHDDIFYEVGPILYQKVDPYLGEHIQNLISYYHSILDKIIPTQSDSVKDRITNINSKIQRLEEALLQWQKKFRE